MRIPFGRSLALCALVVLTNCGRDESPSGPAVEEPRGRPFLSGGGGSYTYIVIDSFAGTDGTNIVSHTANTGQSWTLNGGWTNKVKIQNNTAQLASGADANNWRMAISTDVADDTFDIWTDYTRGSQNVLGDYAHLEFLAKSGANPPTDRVYISISRQSATTVMIRVIRTLNFSTAQSIILDSAFPLDTGATKRFGATVTGLSLQVWWEPAGGGTRTNIGSAVTLTADYRDGLHKRVAFNFVGAQAFSVGSPRIDNFIVARPLQWPVLVDTPPVLDTTRLVQLPSGRFLYRANVTLRFKTGTSDAAKAAFFSQYSMTVVGVTLSGRFFVGIPDPGPSLDSLFNKLQIVRAQPQIDFAAALNFSPLEPAFDSRFPTDGPGQTRADWVGSASTWAMRAVRAPLVWGCETGNYHTPPQPVGIFEWKHQRDHPEFAISAPTLWQPPDAPLAHLPARLPAVVDSLTQHAAATTGLLVSDGNNASGIAGMSWRTGLRLFAGLSSPGNHPLPIPDNFFVLAQALAQGQIRVLSLSADVVVDSTHPVADRQQQIQSVASDIENLILIPLPNLLIVVAAGNEQFRSSPTAYTSDPRAKLMRAALLLLRVNPAYSQRIIVVAGTMQGNAFWDVWSANPNLGSNFFTGATDIAGPAQDVTVLDRWTGQTGAAVPTIVSTGTSLSAPLVAGVASLLLTMDSTLTAAQIKDFILGGAQLPRWNPSTLQLEVPQAVTGAPEPVYQLDAYSALQLSARRTGTHLCGNRTWTNGTNIVVQRDTNVLDIIASNLSAVGTVFPFHGGHRIDVTPLKEVIHREGHWQVMDNEGGGQLLTTSGANWSALGRSHDGDTLARLRQIAFNPGPTEFQIEIVVGGQPTSILTTMSGFVPNYQAHSDPAVSFPGYSSPGRELIVPVRPGDGLGPSVTFYAVSLQTGQDTLLWSLPTAYLVGTGVSEDGAEVVISYDDAPPAQTRSCRTEFRSRATGQVLRVLTGGEALCSGPGVSGGFSPAPRIAP